MLYTLYILSMSVVTFSVRYIFFSRSVSVQLSENVKRFLSYTAPCILTAMSAPIVFGSVDQYPSFVHDPYLIAGLAAIALSFYVKNTLLVVVVSMSFFEILRFYC
ncbi:branched-subunit amino acid transport protein [Sinobacterium caligoides]|uniref:Branched-subunit amino acid transport protein n=1 Tax=Sinobacterium caligoides TaxID=933926 RepID=A0A3N2DPQ7_9GAMM|nr:branched-subunit amino acid transport protein [Sinobacterium caligoides]